MKGEKMHKFGSWRSIFHIGLLMVWDIFSFSVHIYNSNVGPYELWSSDSWTNFIESNIGTFIHKFSQLFSFCLKKIWAGTDLKKDPHVRLPPELTKNALIKLASSKDENRFKDLAYALRAGARSICIFPNHKWLVTCKQIIRETC